MQTYDVECEGETHRLGLKDDRGVVLDHDMQAERIARQLGAEPPPCVEIADGFHYERTFCDAF